MRAPRLALLLLLAIACEDRDKKESAHAPPPATAPNASAVLETLGLDGGALDDHDPPAPSGDLAKDIERFVNVDACVKERAGLDPLVGDALHGIGYDTFLRDACRMLEAAKDRKAETCGRLDSSGLRGRCRAWVAQLSESPDACPLVYDGLPARGRTPACVAVAAKDPRLCAGEGRTGARGTCEALTTGDGARCDTLLGGERASCHRELARWRSLLHPPLAALPPLAKPAGKLVVRGEDGTRDPAEIQTDLEPELRRGAVVVASGGRRRVELGLLGESAIARIPGSPGKRMKLGLAVVVTPSRDGARGSEVAALDRLELEVPGEAPLVLPTAKCACTLTKATVEGSRGGLVALRLEGVLASGTRSFRIEVDLATFVRDVVTDERASRAAPATRR